jgi:Secretion system C-terminal sorting domain/Bacterial Ig domain
MKKISLLLLFTGLITLFASAQQMLNKIMVAEGNSFGAPGNKVKLAAYYPATHTYHYLDSLAGDFTNDILSDSAYTYLHVGTSDPSKELVVRYNNGCTTRKDSLHVSGLQKMALSSGKLVISRGYGADSEFVQIFNANTLAPIASIHEVNQQCSGLCINGSKAYIAVEGSWPSYTDTGLIAVIDLNTNSFDRFIKLDTFAKSVRWVFSEGNFLYAVSSGKYVTVYDLTADTFTHYSRPYISSASGIFSGKLFLNEGSINETFDLSSHSFSGSGLFQGDVSAAIEDTLRHSYIMLNQDYGVLKGVLMQADASGTLTDSFSTGLATVACASYSINHAPTALTDLHFNLLTDHDTSVAHASSDADCDPITYSMVSGPLQIGAVASVNASGTVMYRPATGLLGNDTLLIYTCDAAGACVSYHVYVHVYDAIGISGINDAANMKLYPNPAVEMLHLNNVPSDASIRIMDISGKLCLEANAHGNESLSINVQTLAAGCYHLSVLSANGLWNRTFTKE